MPFPKLTLFIDHIKELMKWYLEIKINIFDYDFTFYTKNL